MTCIPGVRHKTIRKPYTQQMEENSYWEGYLDNDDKNWLKGYDWAVNEVLSMIFDNIGDLELEVEGEDMDMARFLMNHPEIRQKMKDAFEQEFERSRDELVVSMIEDYSQEKYDQLKKVADVIHKVEEDSIQERSEGKA